MSFSVPTSDGKRYLYGVIEKDITDIGLQQHLAEISRDSIDLFLLGDGTLRLACIHGTTLVNHARLSHDLRTTEAVLLGEALLATALCGTSLKENEAISMLLESDGPCGGFVTEVNTAGHLRGYLRSGVAVTGAVVTGPPAPGATAAAPADLLGAGSLDAVRSDRDRSHVSRGHVEWLHGPIAWNLERYFESSEQTTTSIHISTHRDGEGRILGAGALLLQRMPGGSSADYQTVRRMMPAPGTLAQRFSLGQTPTEIVREVFRPWDPRLVSTRNAEFFCPCSRERFARFLGALPLEEIRDILDSGPFPLVTTCHNCSSEYAFSEPELRDIFGTADPADPTGPADPTAPADPTDPTDQGNTFTS